jgi:hypothetical protein
LSQNDAVRATFDADRRRCILLLLLEYNDAANNRTLASVLHLWGHRREPDHVLIDFKWLATAGLVRLEMLRDDIATAMITDKGARVARGEDSVPGVKRT